MSADLSGLSALQRKIYQSIAAEAPDYPEGVDVELIFQRCKNTDRTQVQYVLSLTSPQRCDRRLGQRRLHLSGQRRDTLPDHSRIAGHVDRYGSGTIVHAFGSIEHDLHGAGSAARARRPA